MRNRESGAVRVWEETLVLPTWLPARPDRNPMFLEKRVYQGSSGRVYPLPFTDRIAEAPVPRGWKAVGLENEYLRVLILPELGGRVHALEDRTNGVDLIYRQPVIKPALVGLAGPWISGGIEFNWPQHHRPGTFLPVTWQVETGPGGDCTVWCADHDPMGRLRGLHGLRLRPGHAVLELRVRAYNRTPFRQTFLWWANVATRVHEAYQSFFPPDVTGVADHAKRAMSAFPRARGRYYGIDYGRRAAHGIPKDEWPAHYPPGGGGPAADGGRVPVYPPDDLSFYANIPVPTSYMVVGSRGGFFGGYDHRAGAGIVHVANPHVAPGKKQWTWGNHEFGYAWDRNLTEPTPDGEVPPYIELMAGAYTDNQPDFSFLQPGEVKDWSQYWLPIRAIGPALHATTEGALALRFDGPARRSLHLGVSVTARIPGARVILTHLPTGRRWLAARADLDPAHPWVRTLKVPTGTREGDLRFEVRRPGGEVVLEVRPEAPAPRGASASQPALEPATEPPAPADVGGNDELYLIGLHLEQYRHATRCPTAYWREALRRDDSDSRCLTALGRWHLHRGEFGEAEGCLRRAIDRLTRRNPNPAEGEAHYHLGWTLRFCADAAGTAPEVRESLLGAAYAAWYKATWNEAWAGASFHALAELDALRNDWDHAREHLDRALRLNAGNLRALNLRAMVARASGEPPEVAADALRRVLAQDPLDVWARHLSGDPVNADAQAVLDVLHDLARAGFLDEALAWGRLVALPDPPSGDLPDGGWGAAPLLAYALAWMEERRGRPRAALRESRRASALSPDFCFPARLEEIAVLESAIRRGPEDPRAPYYLGNLLYDRRRHVEALRCWRRAGALDPGFPTVWRNLGIGAFNVLRQPAAARRAYDRAVRADPDDARLLYERDQLWKRIGVPARLRRRTLARRLDLVARRDDLSVEWCALCTQEGRAAEALAWMEGRRFQPWEGGEGQVLEQHVRARLALGREALARGDAESARVHFSSALNPPAALGEARHPLANPADVHVWLGEAWAACGEPGRAREHWRKAATFRGDFQGMRVRAFSEMTFFSALAWGRLGQPKRQRRLLLDLLAHARRLARTPARIDYFATSLPDLLLFEEDPALRQGTTARFLEAQACLGLGRRARARQLLGEVLQRDPSHARAAELRAVIPRGRPRSGARASPLA